MDENVNSINTNHIVFTMQLLLISETYASARYSMIQCAVQTGKRTVTRVPSIVK